MKNILLSGLLGILLLLAITLWLMKQTENFHGYEARLR
jgi:hypothetical protein